MQQAEKHSLEQTASLSSSDAPRGPIALSADLLELVSGGSPRGGWAEAEQARQQLDGGLGSPRGGW